MTSAAIAPLCQTEEILGISGLFKKSTLKTSKTSVNIEFKSVQPFICLQKKKSYKNLKICISHKRCNAALIFFIKICKLYQSKKTFMKKNQKKLQT